MKITALFVLTGLCFGVWPLLMHKSGLPGFASAALFILVMSFFVIPVAFISGQIQQINYSSLLFYGIVAGVVGALGLLLFNTGVAEVKQEYLGSMFMVMVMVQLTIPAVYQMFLSGDLSLKRIVGIVGAFVVAYLLTSTS